MFSDNIWNLRYDQSPENEGSRQVLRPSVVPLLLFHAARVVMKQLLDGRHLGVREASLEELRVAANGLASGSIPSATTPNFFKRTFCAATSELPPRPLAFRARRGLLGGSLRPSPPHASSSRRYVSVVV